MANPLKRKGPAKYIPSPKSYLEDPDHKVCVFDIKTGGWECGGTHNPSSLDVFQWHISMTSE